MPQAEVTSQLGRRPARNPRKMTLLSTPVVMDQFRYLLVQKLTKPSTPSAELKKSSRVTYLMLILFNFSHNLHLQSHSQTRSYVSVTSGWLIIENAVHKNTAKLEFDVLGFWKGFLLFVYLIVGPK